MSGKNTSIKISKSLLCKVAKLYKVNEKQRPFVASSTYKTLAPFLLEQIMYQEKAKKKLVGWPIAKLFFTSIALEQSTPMKVAQQKAATIYALSTQKPSTIYSLTGGLGVDDVCLSNYFDKVISIDTNSFLNDIARYNFNELGIHNIQRQTVSAEEFIAINNIKNSLFYIDPDRRAETNHNNKNVSSFAPNIFKIIPELIKKCNHIFVKLSGATDITWIEKHLQPSQIYVFSLNKEVKEILVVIDGKYKKSNISFISISSKNTFECKESELITLNNMTSTTPTSHILKLDGLFTKSLYLRNNLKPISKNTFFYFCKSKNASDFGKLLSVIWSFDGSFKQLENKLKNEKILHSSVLTRNWKLNSNQTKNKLNLLESNEYQLLIFGEGNKIKAFFCKFK